ncbi:hypothetical protein GQR58_012386 [Nymphon striatum]|nr:hypothetical protein GQR58_012386 [Nymphon striatum]
MSQVKLDCLDNLLRGRRAAITKRIDLINSAVEKGDNAEIEIQCQLLKEAGIKLEAVSEDILSIISEERFDSEIEKQEQYRENIARCFFTVESRKQKAPEGPLGDKKAPLSHNVQVKLPKLFIDPFDGDVLKWTTFFEQFKSSIHENNHLTPIDKFNYLKSLLRGAAANSIMGLPLTASNYNAAIELLQSRFGKPSVIIQGHITRLLSLSLLRSADDITAFRRLLDELQINVRGLDGLGINGTTYSVILIPILVSRLPDSVRFEWAKRENSENATVEQFLEFLNREVELREKASHSINFRVENNKSVTNKVFKSTVSTLYSSSNQLKCPVCSAFHRVVQCTEFLNSDDKEKVIKRLNLCFNCLSPGHRVSQCPSKYTCKICKLKHHSLIHRYKEGSSNSNRAYNNVANISQMSSSSTDNTSSLNADAVLFKPSEPNSAALIAHSNSSNLQNSIHSEQFLLQTAKILVKGEKGHLIANLMFDSASNRSYVRKGLVKQLSCPVMRHEHINCAVFGGKQSTLELKNVRSVCVADRYLHRHHNLELLEVDTICASLQRSAISLKLPHLEGLTLADTFDSSSVIIDILIGMDYYWSLLGSEIVTGPSGPVAQNSVFGYVLSGPTLNSGSSPTFTTLLTLTELSDSNKLWDLDVIGISPKENAIQDKSFEEYTSNIVFDGERYEAPLLWKAESTSLINNENQAYDRLCRLERRFKHEPELRKVYAKTFQEMEDSGIIEEVPKEELLSENFTIFYMPHRPVVKKSSATTKVRPVFDASAKDCNGTSLNDCLDPGPSLLPDLVNVLLRFRRWPIALCADIEKAFLQIKLKKSDKDFHRFLLQTNNEIRHLRFNRVAFGVNCSPFMLNAVIKFHLSLQSASPAVSELSENLYVDDFLTGADSKDEAIELFQNACRIMSTAGMNMCQWSCNNSEVLDAIQKIKAHKVCRFADQTKVLGLAWQRELDCFVFTNGDLMNSVTTSVPTKRTVLSLIARIFDPLGFITPLTIRGKILFQRIWQAGTGWDELLPADLQLVWTQWIKDLSQLQNIEIPRVLLNDGLSPYLITGSNLQIHAFGDASEKAYGAIVYLKSGCNVSFVMSRSRVAPIKKVTLPRLELLAAVLASRLIDYVKSALKLPVNITTYCWSDSQIVLAWIKSSPNRWKTFICNRVTEIQQHTEPSVWRYCPGEYNPADLLTREFVCDISNNMLWWGGPKWLSEEQKGWPCSTFKTEEVPPDEINVCLNVTSNPIKPILDITKFNNYQKMLRVTAYLFRAISIMQKQPTASKQISTEELNYVEFYWYRTLQQEFFYSEYCALRDGSCVKSKSKLKDIHPIWDSSLKLMRLGGRLQYSDLPYSSIHPIIVPHKSYFAKLLILDCHRSHSHCGVSQLICIIRERLWLSRLRSLAKSVVRVCVICRRVNQRACHEIAAPLPSCRINPSPPFNVVGIDFCGPLLLKGSRLKHYVCLFTCATTRAIHLELVDSLKTEEFLLCFRRFIGRRNVPSIIISDNAATFVKASHDSFITSKLLCEVESIINHRPLTYVSEDSEAPCALTPASFLTGASTLSFRDYSAMIDSSAEQLRIRKKHCDKVLDHIWSRWKKEYLLSLPTCVSTFSEGECLKIGAVVLIREDNVPRSCWKLGRVLELIRGRDDRVRAAVLKTSSGTYNRPIQRLHVLESS